MDTTDAVMDLAKRRGFLWPAFEVYGGAAGFYDYGPLGAAMKDRLESLWRHKLRTCAVPVAEVSCPRVTIHEVLKASGHVDEFTDLVVRCGNGHPQRADHLVEAAGYEGTADALAPAGIDEEIRARSPKCPVCSDTRWTGAAPLNLMFQTEIGPGSGRTGYLRPETAQGIFTDFPHLLRHFRGRLPFAGIQVGGSNRNEISPRQGMLRLREFHMMEAEVFFEDTEAPFAGFGRIAQRTALFVPNRTGQPIRTSFGDAVATGMVANEALAYFLALTQDFLLTAGIHPDHLRFRQHLADEMAHYASDCWDAEYRSARYGWVECVGIADRGCYDLAQHARASGKWSDFTTRVRLAEPVRYDEARPVLAKLGRQYKAQARDVAAAIDAANRKAALAAGLDVDQPDAPLPDMVGQTKEGAPQGPRPTIQFQREPVPDECFEVVGLEVHERKIVPRVIEPSFGVDRILWGIWEHSYKRTEKNGEPYVVMQISRHTAPVQVAILPLTNQDPLPGLATGLETTLRHAGLRTELDQSGNIGRRYARQDEVGTPYCVTVDNDTPHDRSVTVRDRDTTEQVRVQVDHLLAHLQHRFQMEPVD